MLDFVSSSASISETGSSAPSPPASGCSSPAARAMIRVRHDAAAHGYRSVSLEPTGIPDSLRQNCAPFIYNMMSQLFSIHSRDEVFFTAPWFSSMLNYLGQEPVLDYAMSALMLQMVGKAKRDAGAQDISRGRDLYGRALASLQRALNHPTAWKAVETFSATIVCCVYEVSRGVTLFPVSHMLKSRTCGGD